MTRTAGPPVAYLDHAATTPVRPETVEAMAPFASTRFANAAASHAAGRDARRAVEEAREQIASVVDCRAPEVVFTSGGTEADNLAIFGTLAERCGPGVSMSVVCSAIEHAAVLEPMRAAAKGAAAVFGIGAIRLEEAGVDTSGVLDLDRFSDALDPDTALVSVLTAGNEVGTLQPMGAAAAIVRERAPGAMLHTDAVQAAALVDLPAALGAWDLVSLSAHKVGGPKGVGALIVREPSRLSPLLHGGGQEHERRSGTHNVAGIVGFASALSLAADGRSGLSERLGALRGHLADSLCRRVPGTTESAPRSATLASHCHLRFDGVQQEELLVLLDRDGVYASAGSSCASGAIEPSHVLLAMGVSPDEARTAIRFSLGHTTTIEEIDRAIDVVTASVERLRD
ncbi:MAG: cysteine desulfurase family protein [Acidimicrobiales bacterium]